MIDRTQVSILSLCLGLAQNVSANADDYRPIEGGKDLVTDYASEWHFLEGATVAQGKLKIESIGRAIVSNGSQKVYVPNPPINLLGPHLETHGDFRISLDLDLSGTQSSHGAFFHFYGTVPIIQDEARIEGKSLAVGIDRGTLVVKFWNGKSALPAVYEFSSGLSNKVKLQIIRTGAELRFVLDGALTGKAETPSLFDAGVLYFGADLAAKDQMVLSNFSIDAPQEQAYLTKIQVSHALQASPQSENSLRSLATSRKIKIGAAISTHALLTDDPYRELAAKEISVLTPENAMKFQFIHPEPNRYAWVEADALVRFAQINKMQVHGHALVWDEAIPSWVANEHSPDVLRQILHDHIITVVSHFKSQISSWDVLNEPIDEAGKPLATTWSKALGADYPDIVFRWAHEADPAAKLYLNEFHVEEKGRTKTEGLVRMIEQMKAHGTPIDGVGLQTHALLEDPDDIPKPALLEANMQRFKELGLLVRISELDYNLPHRTTRDRLEEQANYFINVLQACLSNSNCETFGMWGLTDRYSSLQNVKAPYAVDTLGKGLIFDEALAPKPAYFSLLKGLQSNQ